MRDQTLEWRVTQYLTNAFTPHCDLSHHTKNAVLWTTAMFIENVLTDWNLSGGFWVGQTRFANNDVKNLRDNREAAMKLFERTRKNLAALNSWPQPSVSSTRPVAFVYIVANKLGFASSNAQNIPNTPHLLLIGHTGAGCRHWGVPGGLRDRLDSSTLFSAMRELGEEFLGMKHPSIKAVEGLICTANANGSLSKLMQTPHKQYTAWVLQVDSARLFEEAFRLPRRTVEQKYEASLSNETKGYLWIPLPLNVHRKSSDGHFYVNAPDVLQQRPLILRAGVLSPSKLIR